MAEFDFSAPFVAARIRLPSGDVFPLWVNVGGAETLRPRIPGTEDIQALAFVQQVEVQLNLSTLPKISVQMSPPFEDGMKFLDSPLADGRITNALEVQLGYAGGTGDGGAVLSPLYVAGLTAPEVSIGRDIQITLKGQGLGRSTEIQGGRVVAEDRDTLEDIIRRLVQGAGNRTTLEVDFSAVEATSRAGQALRTSAAGYCQGGRSDWIALWDLAERTHCFMNIVGPARNGQASKLLWLPKYEAFTAPPSRRYRLYHYTGGLLTEEEWPLISFQCNTEAIWTAVAYQDILNHGAVLHGVNADSVSAEEHSTTVEDQAAPVLSGEGVQTTEGTDELPDTALTLPGSPDNSEAVSRAGAEVAAGGPMSIQCEIETLGDPRVLPGDVVAMSGLGRRFDNRLYGVFSVTHTIGVGGFSTNLVVQSDVDPNMVEGRTPTGPRNTADVRSTSEHVANVRS